MRTPDHLIQLDLLDVYESLAVCMAVFSGCIGSRVYPSVKAGKADTHTALPCLALSLQVLLVQLATLAKRMLLLPLLLALLLQVAWCHCIAVWRRLAAAVQVRHRDIRQQQEH
jgi:hypothetical protein